MTRTWPEDWEARKAGEACPFCEQGRVASDEHGFRFYEGRTADAYLQRSGPAPGYSIVVFRGRHVSDPTKFTLAEQAAFWTDVRHAARLIDEVFEPAHLNYQVLGNAVPHVHAHIIPRYVDDPSPSRPLGDRSWAEAELVPPKQFEQQLATLEAARVSAPFVFPLRHAGLTADMFVVRDGRILVLTRAGNVGGGIEYIPGGVVDPGEDPLAAGVRETREETGLELRDVLLLRVWSYPVPEGWETVHATGVGYSDTGDVTITAEHTAYRWVTVDEYIEQWCSEEMEQRFAAFGGWIRHVRHNCNLVKALLT